MKKELTLSIDENILLRFNMALQLNNENCDEVCEDFMKNYFIKSFSKETNIYAPTQTLKSNDNAFYGKALNKISKWASKPTQICHKIIRAYLQLREEDKIVTYDNLMFHCSDEDNHSDVYVPTFATNFTQMKIDGEKSHGKVFVVNENNIITIWNYVEEEIMKHKDEFMKTPTTEIGYVNRNNQMNTGKTDLEGTDHMQKLYIMRCGDCGHEYFANGSDIFLKKCPKCQGGADTGYTK